MAGKMAEALAAAKAQAAATGEAVDDAEMEMDGFELADSRPRAARKMPIFEGARVVYTGSARNKSISITGRLLVDKIEDEEGMTVLKAGTDEGVSCYDFTTHDARGALIRSRLMPSSPRTPLALVGRPFLVVEHPEHLRHFQRWRNANNETEFQVLIPRALKADYDEYVRRVERSLADTESLYEETQKR